MERVQLSGIPVFYAEGDSPGMVSLEFRVGHADEPPQLRGITHLIEHLALHSLGRQAYEYNASVNHAITEFWAVGTMADLEHFTTTVTTNLANLPMDRVEAEKQVLATEADDRGPAIVPFAMSLRYGYRAHGATELPEFGLSMATAEDVKRWASTFFTQGNCAISLHAPEVPAWELPLPPGPTIEGPTPRVLPSLQLPAFERVGNGKVVATLEVSKTWDSTIGGQALAIQLEDSLRLRDAVTYDVTTDYVRVGTRGGHMSIVADCMDENADAVAQEMYRQVTGAAKDGIPANVIDLAKQRVLRAIEDNPNSVRSDLDTAAVSHLFGEPFEAGQFIAEIQAVNETTVRDVFARSIDGLLMVVPSHCAAPGPGIAEWEAPLRQVEGHVFKSKGLLNKDWAMVGPDGVRYCSGGADWSIPAESIVLIERRGEHCFEVLSENLSYLTLYSDIFKETAEMEAALAALAPGGFVFDNQNQTFEIERLAASTFSDVSDIEDELRILPQAFESGEKLLCLAKGRDNRLRGLVALTSRRLIFLRIGQGDAFNEYRRSDILSAEKAGITGSSLKFRGHVGEKSITDISPKKALEQMLGQLNS